MTYRRRRKPNILSRRIVLGLMWLVLLASTLFAVTFFRGGSYLTGAVWSVLTIVWALNIKTARECYRIEDDIAKTEREIETMMEDARVSDR